MTAFIRDVQLTDGRGARERFAETEELWLRPNDGHISIHNAVPVALDWLLARDELL